MLNYWTSSIHELWNNFIICFYGSIAKCISFYKWIIIDKKKKKINRIIYIRIYLNKSVCISLTCVFIETWKHDQKSFLQLPINDKTTKGKFNSQLLDYSSLSIIFP